MARTLTLLVVATSAFGLTGCASSWDVMTSQRFRESPFKTMFNPDDPLTMLREHSDNADIKARAFQRLDTDDYRKLSKTDQDYVLNLLGSSATSDPNPWVRIAAVDALGRCNDPQAVQSLVAAYHQATGRTNSEKLETASPTDPPAIFPVSAGRAPTPLRRFDLTGPKGFTADQIATLRGRAIESLARTGSPEAVQLLSQVALDADPALNDDVNSKEFVRQQAVASLGTMRTAESVQALAKVLSAEQGKDLALARMAHRGLVELTGQRHPADPETWNQVVQAGYQIAPPQNAVQRAIGFDSR